MRWWRLVSVLAIRVCESGAMTLIVELGVCKKNRPSAEAAVGATSERSRRAVKADSRYIPSWWVPRRDWGVVRPICADPGGCRRASWPLAEP